ncbi:N-acetylmuramoyl-L-alanine amidase family protein [Cohnella silvisoli]|uniref:N-acetylmuramoyl-L-alanine amidase n=1 Tax=Cohnella silvisoli TaxID=2873699 RepID=A0ABV1L519_9BACL|nr:N-acetylmuramoyl-L-alanine amidase [Cohnella silvisoli]MCD9026134.1 N-acetylmuramoyl-L-alanine amidase [Cohnella silvisoli]
MLRVLLILCSVLLLTSWKAGEPADIKRALPTADVLIDAGHGGIDGGTHWNGVLEKDINLAIARKLYLLLRSKGLKVILNRTGDYALSDDNRWQASRSRHRRDLSQRRGLSDEIGASLFVSIHVNWAPKTKNRGPLVIHQDEGRSTLLAGFIQNSLNLQQGRSRLPRVANQFYLLNRVQVPSVIVETAFLNDPGDRKMLTSIPGQNRIAAAIANGIIGYRCFAP